MIKKLLLSILLIGLIIPTVPVQASVTTSTSVNTNELTEVDSLVGHYQFNVTAGSNVNSKGDRGYSHVESMKTYEKNHSNKLLGNSSGGYLDSAYNEGGSIYKAYLVIESSTVDFSLADYPITFVSGTTNNKMESKVEYYCFDTTYSSGNERRSGYLDVTDFVKKNGYGWYYVCNIPYCTDGADWNSDQFAGWKLVVIEENYNVPMRMLKLKLGSKNIMSTGSNASITIEGDGIKTSRINEITGQFLFGMAGADPSAEQNNSILYACSNNKEKYDYKTITTKSGVRTPTNPLVFISSRNGNPLNTESQFENPVYFDGKDFISKNKNGSYQTGAGDLELLDINTSSEFYHDVKLDKGQSYVTFKFETVTECALMTSVLGLAVDIDVPNYDNQCNITYDKEKNEFTIDGVLSNNTDLFDIGIISPVFTFDYDPNLVISNYEARITSLVEDDSAKLERKLNNAEISVDKENSLIKFNINGTQKDKKMSKMNIKNDVLYYKIVLVPTSVLDYYDNTIYIDGTLFSSGTDTGLYLDKISAKTIRNSLDGVVTKRNLAGKIIWNDDGDKNGYRPTEVEVSLCMDSVPIDNIDITGRGNVWEYDFSDLNIYKTLDYQYEYEAQVQKEYEHYTVSYDGNDIIFDLEQKHIPENNVLENSINISEKVISDLTLFNLDLTSINNNYNITEKINNDYKEKIIN